MLNDGEIIRSRSQSNFTIVPNNLLRDTRLSFRAIGLMCHILHFPDNWKFNKTTLHKGFKEGRDAVMKAWDELAAAGYISSEMIQDKDTGKMMGYFYTVRDTPLTDFQETVKNWDNPVTEKPVYGKPVTENPQLYNTIYTSTNEQSTNNPTSFISSDEEIKERPAEKSSGKATKNKKTKTPPGSAAPSPKEKKPYERLLDIYYEWYKEKTNGIRPKIDGVEINAIKSLTVHLIGVVKDKKIEDNELTYTPEELQEGAENALRFIFKHWHRLDEFTQHQVKLSQINSNISNIIIKIKEHAKQIKPGTNRTAEERVQGIHNAVNEYLNR